MNKNEKEQLEVINQQIKELVGIYRGVVSRSGISENEYWIWYALIIMEGEYSQQDICNSWSLSKQTVNTIVMNMVKRELVFLEVVPGTRNRKIIRLTQAGKKYGENIVRPVSEVESRAFNRLPETDRLACTAAFGRYINILKEELYGTENRQTL
ncbi:MAG TPA: MarR family transcriptional regulator [Lachnospiraceae bacterium]|nr:MarR family transcriptional regulator [Lachnospiraceae bacterium]